VSLTESEVKLAYAQGEWAAQVAKQLHDADEEREEASCGLSRLRNTRTLPPTVSRGVCVDTKRALGRESSRRAARELRLHGVDLRSNLQVGRLAPQLLDHRRQRLRVHPVLHQRDQDGQRLSA
jgi:hypothetical protein